MTHNSGISAVVVTWNNQNDIFDCLSSLQAQTNPPDDIIIVDNCSKDRTISLIKEYFPTVYIERRSRNEGFARANNIGINITKSPWVLTVNPDVKLSTDWIKILCEFAKDKERIGSLGGVLWKWGDNYEGIVDSTGIEIFTSRRVRDKDMGATRSDILTHPERVFGICAAAALYNREMLEDTAINNQYFPERFFCYYEDVDLAWRAWRRGWEAWTVPSAQGWHKRGAFIPTKSSFSRYLTHRNHFWLILRNDKILSFIRDLPTIILYEVILAMRVIRYPILLKAVFETLVGLRGVLEERREFIETNHIPPPFRKGIGLSKKDWLYAIGLNK